MSLPYPQRISSNPDVNASAMAWAAQLVDALQRGGGPWREVGATGEPAFEGTWVNFAGGLATAAFYKDVLGIVHVKGSIKTGTVNTTAFTLPLGYRPELPRLYAVDSNSALGVVRVNDTGTVVPAVGSNLLFSLDGISFRAS